MQKIQWVDSGKGFAIILVVLVHTVNWLLDAGLGVPVWAGINDVFATMRMPLFFLMSGLFAQKWITAGWKELASSKLLFLYWVFLLWTVIGSFIHLFGLALQGNTTTPANFIGALVLSPIRPRFELWFVWALALFFIAAKATRKWPLPVQFGLAAVAAFVWQSGFVSVNIGWDGAAKHYLFFLLGVTYRPAIFKSLNQVPVTARVCVILAWAALAVWMVTTPAGDVPGLKFIGSLLGVCAGIGLSSMLTGVKGLRYLGRNTLPIYLAHTPIVVLIAFSASFGVFEVLPVYIRAVVPLLVAAASIALALGLHRLAMRAGLAWLYEPPTQLSATLGRRIGV